MEAKSNSKVIGSTTGLDSIIDVDEVDPTIETDLVQFGASLGIEFKENLGPFHLGWPKILEPKLCHIYRSRRAALFLNNSKNEEQIFLEIMKAFGQKPRKFIIAPKMALH